MKNYISVNAKYFKSSQIHKIYNHNQRVSTIDYLLNEEDRQYKNLTYTTSDKLNLIEHFSEQFNKKCEDQKAHNFFKPKTGNENEIIEMVVALSEDKALEYLNQENGEELIMQGYIQLLKDIEKKYGFKGLEVSLHTDEGYYNSKGEVKYNVHAHITFLNYDFDKSKTILRTLKVKDWSHMQDMAQESFQKHDLDFIRGESKEVTNKEHLERNDFIIQKQQESIEVQLKQLNENKKKLTKQVQIFNKNKNHLKHQRASYERTSKEYKELTPLFKEMQEQEKQAREEKRQLEKQIKALQAYIEKELEKANIEQNEINKNINALKTQEKAQIQQVNENSKVLVTQEEKIASNTTLNAKLEQEAEKKKAKKIKSSQQFNTEVNDSIETIKDKGLTAGFKNSNFEKVIKSEIKKHANYNLQVKEYVKLKEENEQQQDELLAQDETIKNQTKKIQTLTQENQTQKTQIQKLENDNLALKDKTYEQQTQIDRLIHIIKTITGFTGNTLKSIFDSFMPNDTTDSHEIK